jgi:hypothetical protein
MDGGDRRLELIRAQAPARQRVLDQRDAFADRAGVPQRAVLLGERD